MKIRGLRRLHLDFSNIPAEIALGCIVMHTIHLPSISVGTSIEFEVPRSLNLWDNADPSAHIRQLLQETPSNTTRAGTASLFVLGFPGSLPDTVEASRTAMVCGYPVFFMKSDVEE